MELSIGGLEPPLQQIGGDVCVQVLSGWPVGSNCERLVGDSEKGGR